MSQDYFSRLQNAKANTSGGFEPGYVVEKVTAVVHPNLEKSKAFGFRFGANKRWIDRTDVFPFDETWLVNTLKGKGKPHGPKEIEAARARHDGDFKALLEFAAVDDRISLMGFIMEEVEAGRIPVEQLNEQFIFERVAAKLCEDGRLTVMTEMAARNSAITNEHVEKAKVVSSNGRANSLYYSGRVRMIPFAERGDFEGKTPPERPLPQDFETVNLMVSQDNGEAVEGGQEPPADVNGPPPF